MSSMHPDLAAALMGSGASDPAAGSFSGPPMDAGPDTPADTAEDATGDVGSLLNKAIKLVRQATDAEVDPEGKHALEDISTRLQKILADEQKLTDSATGTTPGHKLVRKVMGGSPMGGGGYGG